MHRSVALVLKNKQMTLLGLHFMNMNMSIEYYEDEDSRTKLKEWIISKTVSRSFNHRDAGAEILAYMGIDITIQPDQILEYKELN